MSETEEAKAVCEAGVRSGGALSAEEQFKVWRDWFRASTGGRWDKVADVEAELKGEVPQEVAPPSESPSPRPLTNAELVALDGKALLELHRELASRLVLVRSELDRRELTELERLVVPEPHR